MTTFSDNTLERQLSSLFHAEAQDVHLPSGTWQAINLRMGEPDRPNVLWRLRNAFTFPQWRNPMNMRYAASVATLLLAAIAAILFVMLSNDDADNNNPVPAVSPTVASEPTATPLRFEPTPATTPTSTAEDTPQPSVTPGLEGVHTIVAGAKNGFPNINAMAFDGEHLWFAEGTFAVKVDLEGNRVASFQAARNLITSMTAFEGFLWVHDTGEREVRKISLEGETIERFPAGDALGIGSHETALSSYSPSNGLIERDSDWNIVHQIEVDATDGIIRRSGEQVFLWKDSRLRQISNEGVIQAEWDAPTLPIEEPNRSDEIQVKGGYVWLTGYSRTEFTRIDPASGETLVIELPVYDGEFTSNGVFVSHPTALVLEDSVWVAYMRFGEPDLDPSESGLFFGETSFRRLSVYDHDGKPLREEVIVEPGISDEYFQLLFPASLQPIRILNDDVWIGVGAEPGKTLFKVFTPDFLEAGR